jgi:plastocyanin
MNTIENYGFSKSCRTILATLFFAVQSLWATTHVVQFGGTVGFAYSPVLFTATIGDTVKWEGAFSMHPLSSTVVPAGAQTWQNSSGSSFIYVIKVAGAYAYQCDLHAGLGMVGAFTATGLAVRNSLMSSRSNSTEDVLLGVSEISAMPYVTLSMTAARRVTIKIFDLSGRERAMVLDRVVPAGTYSLPIGSLLSESGYYFVKFSSGGVERVASFALSN